MHLCLIPSHDESRGPSFNRRAERRRSFILTPRWAPEEFRCSGSGPAAPRQVLPRPGSPEPWAAFALPWPCCCWPRPCSALPPHVSAALAPIPAPCLCILPPAPASCLLPPASCLLPPASVRPLARPAQEKVLGAPAVAAGAVPCAPVGDSRCHPRVAWLWVEKLPELEKCAENCSVICSLCSTGTWSWLELNLGSWQQILSNTSPVQAWLKRQMQNGLCTVGLAQL